MVVYRKNWVNPSADRYSRLAEWQVHKTRQEIETAFRPLNLGEIRGMRVIERGPSERPVSTEITGSLRKANVRALNLRTMLGLRDSLFYFDEERNAKGRTHWHVFLWPGVGARRRHVSGGGVWHGARWRDVRSDSEEVLHGHRIEEVVLSRHEHRARMRTAHLSQAGAIAGGAVDDRALDGRSIPNAAVIDGSYSGQSALRATLLTSAREFSSDPNQS